MASMAGRRTDIEDGGGPTFSLFGGRGRLLALLAAVLFVLWLARGIIGPFVVAAVLAYAFSPLISAVEDRTRLPRALIVAIGYLIALGLIALVAIFVAERAGSEINYLTSGGPDIIATALRKIVGDHVVVAGMTYDTGEIAGRIREALLGMIRTPSDAFHMAEQAVDVGLQAILCLIVTFYFLLDGRRFGHFALGFLERSQRADALRIGHHIHVVLGRWLRGQLLLIALVATVLYLILGPILHIPYALALSMLSGVLEIIPLVGPIIAASLAATVAFATHGTNTTIVVLAVYLVVRQVEDQIVMPLVIGRAVHLHPVVTIFAVLVGLSTFGVLGGLLGVPVAAALNVTLHELYPDETGNPPEETERPSRVRLRLPRGRSSEVKTAKQERTAQVRPGRSQARRTGARRLDRVAEADAEEAESPATAEEPGAAKTEGVSGGPTSADAGELEAAEHDEAKPDAVEPGDVKTDQT